MRKNLFDHARTVAISSTYKYRHGAILVSGNSIIKASPNKIRPVGFISRYHENNYGTLHAEVGCVLNLKKEKTRGCDIYVCRIAANNFFANSKPCKMCQSVCSEMGIKRIYYSIDESNFGDLKL